MGFDKVCLDFPCIPFYSLSKMYVAIKYQVVALCKVPDCPAIPPPKKNTFRRICSVDILQSVQGGNLFQHPI